MYMCECKIFPFFNYSYVNTYKNSHPTHALYNCTEKIPTEPFCYSLPFNEIDALKVSS